MRGAGFNPVTGKLGAECHHQRLVVDAAAAGNQVSGVRLGGDEGIGNLFPAPNIRKMGRM